MHRYYFDWHEGDRLRRDEDGLDLPDLDAVRQEAAQALAERASVGATIERRELAITVRDEGGLEIFTTSIVFETKNLTRKPC